MTPQEIADHKRRWMGSAKCRSDIHSDYTRASRSWLKDHVPKHQYHVLEHTDVYQTSIVFENNNHQQSYLVWYEGVREECTAQ